LFLIVILDLIGDPDVFLFVLDYPVERDNDKGGDVLLGNSITYINQVPAGHEE